MWEDLTSMLLDPVREASSKARKNNLVFCARFHARSNRSRIHPENRSYLADRQPWIIESAEEPFPSTKGRRSYSPT